VATRAIERAIARGSDRSIALFARSNVRAHRIRGLFTTVYFVHLSVSYIDASRGAMRTRAWGKYVDMCVETFFVYRCITGFNAYTRVGKYVDMRVDMFTTRVATRSVMGFAGRRVRRSSTRARRESSTRARRARIAALRDASSARSRAETSIAVHHVHTRRNRQS
jgi:hypothetical protein